MLEFALLTIFPGALILAGAMDLFTLTIPNRISIVLIGAFFVLAPLAGFGLEDIAWHVAAGLAFLAIGVGMFALNWLGGGDAKILAVAALWIGFAQAMDYVFIVAIAGGVLALSLLLFRSIMPPKWLLKQDWVMRLHDTNGGIPYGVALAVAGLLVYPDTPWFSALVV